MWKQIPRATHYVAFAVLPMLLLSCTTTSNTGRELAGARIDVRDLSPDLRKAAECISGLLKSVSGVQEVRLGALRNRIRAFAVITYDIVDKASVSRTVEFALWNQEDDPSTDAIYDEAYALGLVVSDEVLLNDDIETAWKAKCKAAGFLQTGPVLGPDK